MLLFYLSLIEDDEGKTKFEQLYIKYRAPMILFVTKMLGNDNHSEDIVHDSFLKLLKHMEKINDINSHKTQSFIVTIVRNRCYDFLRVNNKRVNITYNKENEIYCIVNNKTQYNLEEIELFALIDKIREIPIIYRDVFMFKYYYGYNDKEIADMFGIARSTVRKRLERARGLLNGSLEDWRR